VIVQEYKGYEEELAKPLTKSEELFALNARVDILMERFGLIFL
jgi:hypothetical protein